jgi:hypothetical protein
MRRRSPLARLWAFAAAFTLAFTQVALAAYACPIAAPHEAHAGSGHAMQMADGAACPEMDPGSSPLCVKTCEDEPQKYEVPSLAAAPPSSDGGLRVAALPFQDRGPLVIADAAIHRATSPPPVLLFARFLK